MSAFGEPTQIDDQFFARNVPYEMMGEQVVLLGRDGPTMTTVDDWGQLVFLAADGEHTVGELIAHLAGKYPSGAPKELPDQVRHVVRDMTKAGFLVVRPRKAPPLAYYLSMPMQQQDVQRSKRLMESDGFIKRVGK